MAGYHCFAMYYDRLTTNVDYRSRAAYFHTLIQKYMPNADIVVDLACGTGSLSVELEPYGYDLIAIEGSRDMLSVAASKPAKRILYLCQDMREIDLYGTVDVVICALDSLNHLPTLEDVKRVFARVALFLDPNGVFLFDVNTVYKHERILSENCFVIEQDDLFCVWQNGKCEHHVVDMQLDFFEKTGGQYVRHTELLSERAYTQQEIAEAVAAAGMYIYDRFDEDSFDPPREESQRWVYVVGKADKQNGKRS